MKISVKFHFLILFCFYFNPFIQSAYPKSAFGDFKTKHLYSFKSFSFQKDSSDFLLNAFKKGHSKDKIISIPKGHRPLPSNYLKRKYIRRHLRKFKSGASFLIPEDILGKFGRTILGRNDGQFVMCKKEMDDLISNSNGEITFIEIELGIPSGLWNNIELIRIDIPKPKRLHIRMPSGNEIGANELWIPGGKLPNGFSESVIDPIPQGQYSETKIKKK